LSKKKKIWHTYSITFGSSTTTFCLFSLRCLWLLFFRWCLLIAVYCLRVWLLSFIFFVNKYIYVRCAERQKNECGKYENANQTSSAVGVDAGSAVSWDGATTKSAKKQIKQMHTHSSIAFQLGMELENKTLAFVIFEMPN